MMVDYYGRWTPEKDYSTYPIEKWCDLDFVADYIIKSGYTPKIEMEKLCNLLLDYYADDCGNTLDHSYLGGGSSGLMVNIEGLAESVKENGGIAEFDYEV